MKKLNRRRIIQGSAALLSAGALSVDPTRSLLSAMLRGLVASARRRVAGDEPARNYLKIHLYGSPARYIFDHPLRPSDQDGFVANPHVINQLNPFDGSQPHSITGRYAEAKTLGINMPYLFGFNVPAADGGERPLAELAQHMMVLRGCDMVVDGHPGNSGRLVAPVPGGPSMTGLVAERSRTPIPALSLGRSPASRAYRSPRGVGVVELPPESEDYAKALLEAFNPNEDESTADRKNQDAAVDEALEALQAYARGSSPGSEIIAGERVNAEQMIRRGIAEAANSYPAILKKYQQLVLRALTAPPIPGVMDRPVPGIRFPFSVPGRKDTLAAMGRHRLVNKILCPDDYVAALSSGKVQTMASDFAIAEFALTEGLSSSVLVAPPNEMGLMLARVKMFGVELDDISAHYDAASDRTSFLSSRQPELFMSEFPFDSHTTGTVPTLVVSTIYFRALGACMLEIIDSLKRKAFGGGTLFDETVVHLSSEFERLPSADGADSSHSFRAHVTSLYSGIIKSPSVIGNIRIGSAQDLGTVGLAAPVEGLKNRIIGINNISSTLSQLLRVPRIVPRAQPLLEVRGDKITPTVELARNVEGPSDYSES